MLATRHRPQADPRLRQQAASSTGCGGAGLLRGGVRQGLHAAHRRRGPGQPRRHLPLRRRARKSCSTGSSSTPSTRCSGAWRAASKVSSIPGSASPRPCATTSVTSARTCTSSRSAPASSRPSKARPTTTSTSVAAPTSRPSTSWSRSCSRSTARRARFLARHGQPVRHAQLVLSVVRRRAEPGEPRRSRRAADRALSRWVCRFHLQR